MSADNNGFSFLLHLCRIHLKSLCFLLVAFNLLNFSGMEISRMDIVVKGHISNLQLIIYRRDGKDKDGVLAYPYSQIFSYRQRKKYPSLTWHYEVLSI